MARPDAYEIEGTEITLSGIRGACRFYGGVKNVATAAGFMPSNLTRWLKGRASLPHKHIESMLEVLDLPGGKPRTDIILHWRSNVYWDDMRDALRLYFPGGADVLRAPWSRPGISNALKFFALDQIKSDKPLEIYLLKSGDVRVVIRQPPGFLLYEDMLGDGFKMKTEEGEVCEFEVKDNESAWFRGEVTLTMFEQAFDGMDVSWERVVEIARAKGVKRKCILDWLNEQ